MAVKILYWLICFLGIATPAYKKTLYKYFWLIFMVAYTVEFIYYVNVKIQMTRYNLVIKLIDIFANFFLLVTCTVVTVLNVFIYSERVRDFLQEFRDFNTKLKMQNSTLKRIFWISIVIFHVSIFAMFSIDGYYGLTIIHFKEYAHCFLRDLGYYKLFITLFMISGKAVEIGFGFKKLNELLKYSAKQVESRNTVASKQSPAVASPNMIIIKDIRYISRLYNQLCDMVDQHNENVGIFILLSVLFIVIFCVQYTTIFIYYIIEDGEFSRFRLQVIIVACNWLILSFVSM